MLLSKIKKIPKNTNGRLAIPALAGLLVLIYNPVEVSSVVFLLDGKFTAISVYKIVKKVIDK